MLVNVNNQLNPVPVIKYRIVKQINRAKIIATLKNEAP